MLALGTMSDIEGISVIVPTYNEEGAIEATLSKLKEVMGGVQKPYEIIVVDDGSKDQSAEVARRFNVRVLSHHSNQGYGASLKTGIRSAQYAWIAITDADGTYPIEELPRLLNETPHYDMVVGARTGKNVRIPWLRRPAKWLIGQLANYLSGYKIPDLNSGLRIFRKSLAQRFFTLMPEGFSFTTTLTVAALSSGHAVQFLPINYHKRVGSSSIRPLRDFLGFIFLVIRLVTYFKPLNVFMPVALILFSTGFVKGVFDFIRTDAVGVGSSLVMVTGVQLAFLGLVADLILKRTTL